MKLSHSDADRYRRIIKEDKKLTIEEAAKEIEISKNTLVNALKSRRLRLHVLEKIIKWFGEDIDDTITIIHGE